jgi:hypothetical protein
MNVPCGGVHRFHAAQLYRPHAPAKTLDAALRVRGHLKKIPQPPIVTATRAGYDDRLSKLQPRISADGIHRRAVG